MKLIAPLLALVSLSLQGSAPDQEDDGPQLELRAEKYPNGERHSEFQVYVGEDGADVLHGTFESWFQDGRLQQRGRHKDGRRVGTWEAWHANGQLASTGNYRRGLRHGEWRYFEPDGKGDDGRGGKYKGVLETFEDGSPRREGELRGKHMDGVWREWRQDGSLISEGEYRFNKRSGPWTWYAPDGSPRLWGSFKRGERVDTWAFRHATGLVDPEFVSGIYKKGRRKQAAPKLLVERLTPDSPLLDVAALPEPALHAGLTEGDLAQVESLLARFTSDSETVMSEALAELITWEDTAIPAVLKRLRALDPARPADALLGYRFTYSLLSALTGGHVFEWKSGTTPADITANRLALLRWHTLWALTGADPDFWQVVRGTDPEKEPDLLFGLPLAAAESGPVGAVASAADDGPSAVMRAREGLVMRRHHLDKYGGKGTTDALEAALEWLAIHQDPDGGWDADGFMRQCDSEEPGCEGIGQPHQDVGVTGLALLALCGNGHTTEIGEYSANVRAGLKYLRGRQNASTGLIGGYSQHDFLYRHGIATMALIAAGDARHPKLREAVQRAVDYILAARNPYAVWRYDAPPQGNNDTSVTGWMISALSMAEQHGYRVPSEAYVGTLAWLDQVTEEATGRVGYDSIGSLSSRTTTNDQYLRQDSAAHPAETMTAVGAWCRILAGQDPGQVKQLEKHHRLLLANPPVYEPEGLGNDVYYWYYGTYAMFQLGGKDWRTWNGALTKAARTSQRQDGHASGSWDPVGPWGYAGGRVYTTAMMALCLEVYWRYPRMLE